MERRARWREAGRGAIYLFFLRALRAALRLSFLAFDAFLDAGGSGPVPLRGNDGGNSPPWMDSIQAETTASNPFATENPSIDDDLYFSGEGLI